MESAAYNQRVYAAFVDHGRELAVPDFCHQFGGRLPQIVRVRDGPGQATGTKDKTFFINKVCSEEAVGVDVIKKKNKKKLGTVCLPLSLPVCVRLAGGPKDAPGHSLTEILRRRINPCDVIVCPKDHFKMEVKGKQRTTKDLILHLREKETMGSLIGNPVTETSISEEEVRLPWDCRLRVVTSMTGYPGDWSSYLHLIADTLKSKQTQKENSRPAQGEYLQISQDYRRDEHKYEDIDRPRPKCCVYEVMWDAKSGRPVIGSAVSGPGTDRESEGPSFSRHPPNREDKGQSRVTTDAPEVDTAPGGKENDPGGILTEMASPKIVRKTNMADIPPKRTDSRKHLYDVSWDPKTRHAVVDGHVLESSIDTGNIPELPPRNASGTSSSSKGVAVSESKSEKQTDSQHVGGYHSLPLPSAEFNPQPPSIPPRRPSRCGILISDLPKPVHPQSKSLDRMAGKKHPARPGRSQSEDMGCGVCLRELHHNPGMHLSAETDSDRLRQIPFMSVSEVISVLVTLKIRCVDKFREHSIDGAKLLKLADVICVSPEFQLSKIDVLKLQKFIQKGYLPKI